MESIKNPTSRTETSPRQGTAIAPSPAREHNPAKKTAAAPGPVPPARPVLAPDSGGDFAGRLISSVEAVNKGMLAIHLERAESWDVGEDCVTANYPYGTSTVNLPTGEDQRLLDSLASEILGRPVTFQAWLPPRARPCAGPPEAEPAPAIPLAPCHNPAAEKAQASYLQLAAAAADLNAASDTLGTPISDLDAALKRLNLGIVDWVTFASRADGGSGDYDNDQIGYAKINGKWGLAIRNIQGNDNSAYDHRSEEWLFGDAPRAMRVGAVGKIPDLIDQLTKKAAETTQHIIKKAAEAKEIAIAINAARDNTQPKSSRK
jgi:hypothetical protein